ncbi:MAG: CBS domain-containing protein [Anaerolineaceae bacterium]|nr:CBS domain-containing protein [Anaerolineaceae bacterium]
MQTTIRHILEVKGYDLWSIGPKATVFDALRMMSDKDIGALIILEGDKMVGIMSERDYARKVVLLGKTSRDTLVEVIMSKHVYTIHPDQTVEEAMEMMYSKHIRHLPVVEDGNGNHVLGMISIGDVVKAIIYKQREAIKEMEDKIIS